MRSPEPENSNSRASIACTACQARRVKCIKSAGNSTCNHCQRGKIPCVSRQDKRRRPISRAEVDSLRSRLQSLESLLRNQSTEESSTEVPLPSLNSRRSPKSQDVESKVSDSGYRGPTAGAEPLTSLSASIHASLDRREGSCGSSPNSLLADTMSEGPSKVLVGRLISGNAHLMFDRSSGRLRYFGPVTAFHQFSEANATNTNVGFQQQNKIVDRVLRDLDPDTHNHLMESYWACYDPIMQVVDRDTFEQDRESNDSLAYGGLLHICILAMGYRYADSTRSDIQKLTLANRESTLHKEAKYLVEFEFERPGGIPSVQALLLLSELETGCGRDTVGWMYAGMAFRLAFDLGLNLDCSTLSLSHREQRLRHHVLRACTAFDKFWAIYLGRLTCIKSSDFIRNVSTRFALETKTNATNFSIPTSESIETLCFNALLRLLDLTTKIVEHLYLRQMPQERSDYLVMAGLDNELKSWYTDLPVSLRWEKDNAETAPLSFFHLHSQYHASLILLHRPFALCEVQKSDVNRELSQTMDSLAAISRAVCMEHSSRMAQLFARQTLRFDPIRTPQTQLQHLGTAVAALISAIAISKSPQQRLQWLQSLHALGDFVRKISPTYRCAEIISDVLETILKEPGWELGQMSDMRDHQRGNMTATLDRMTVCANSFEQASQRRPSRLTPSSITNLNSHLDFDFEPGCNPQNPELTSRTSLASAPAERAQQLQQHADMQEDLDQSAFALLAGWPTPSHNTSSGLGGFYTQQVFNGTDDDCNMIY